MIQARRVTKTFGDEAAVRELSFGVAEGDVVGLIGPNGSGKTTMIRLLCGLLRPDEGELKVLGVDPLQCGDQVRAASGVLTESAAFYAHMSGPANLRFFAELYGVEEQSRPAELLELFGLDEADERPVSAYSTGMRKRLGLAKALLHKPRLLFLDEPTNGLDPDGTRLVLQSIRQLQSEWGTTVLICSHLLQQLELVCQRFLMIRQGELLDEGSLDELRARHRPGVTLEVLSEAPLPPLDTTGVTSEEADSVEEAGRRLWRSRLRLDDLEEVPTLLRALSAQVALYGAAVRQESLEDIYFRVQAGAPVRITHLPPVATATPGAPPDDDGAG